jgi:hypothetical protein
MATWLCGVSWTTGRNFFCAMYYVHMNIGGCRPNFSVSALYDCRPRCLGAHRVPLHSYGLAPVRSNGTLFADCIVHGGVAERLIAPVLKTGRPKGLVSSNLTPSASAWRDLAISSTSREKPLLVAERLYLTSRDIRPVHKSNPFPGIQRDVRGNHIKGVRKI